MRANNTAVSIISKVVSKERTALWLKFVDHCDQLFGNTVQYQNEDKKRATMLKIMSAQFEANPSSDNFALLQEAMWMYQDWNKNATKSTDLRKPNL
jgi:hypothetical protein